MIDTLLQVRSVDQNTDCFNIGTGFEAIGRDEPETFWDNQPYIYEVKLALNNSIFVGGGFNSYNRKPIKGGGNPIGPSMLKIKQDGTVDDTFTNYGFGVGQSFSIRTIEEQSNGKIMVGGSFSSYSGQSLGNIVRLNSTGTIDNTFNTGTGFNNQVNDIEIQSDGKYICATPAGTNTFSGITVGPVVRLNTNGSFDNTFSTTGITGTTYDISIQSDGKILCATIFSSGLSTVRRLNTDGTIDTGFTANVNTNTYTVQQQSDGKIMIGGAFTTVNSTSRSRIARLNSNGTLDTTFTSPLSGGIVRDISIQSNGKYIIIGYDLFGTSTGVGVLRLNTNGTIDTTFNIVGYERESAAIFNGAAEISEILPNGDILLGNFTTYNGVPVGGLVKVDKNGNLLNCVKSNNQFLDLYDDVSVNINMSFSEIQDITSKNSGFSQSFRVPGTRNNNKFFNYMFDVNADNLTFNIQQSVPCTLSYKGETVLDGTLRLLKIYVSNNKVDYEVNVQDEVGLLINDISNKSLFDLDFTDLNHTYNATSVESSWTATYTGGTTTGGLFDGKILYGFSHNGYIYDKSGTTVTTGSNASPLLELSGLPGTISYSGTPMRTTGFKPSIQIYDLTRRIFEQNGYTLESDFFEEEYFQRLYMPLMFVADQYYINSTGATDGTSQIVLSTPRNPIGFDFSGGTCGGSSYQYISVWCPLNQLVSNNGPIYPSSGWNTGSGTFHAWSGGLYKFDYKARISIPFGPQGAQGQIYLCKNLDNSVKYGAISYALEGSFNTQEDIQNTDISITLAPGDTINLVMDFYIAPTGCITGYELIQPDFQITETSVIVTDAPNLIVGSTVDVKQQFTPEYKQLDFLKGLMTQFNLVFVKHPYKAKTYVMEPFDDYVGQGKLIDWTNRIDLSKDITISPITNINGKAINFLYQDEADAMNTFTKSINNNRIFGTYNFIPQNTKINDQPLNITSFFSPTPCDTLPFADILPQPFIVPHLYGAKESTKEGVTNTQLLPMRLKPRILHYYGLQPLSSTWYYLDDVSGNVETKTTYPLIHHQNRIPSITELGTAIDLNFGNSASPQDNVVPTTTTNTGYALYYEDYVNDLLNPDARMFTAYFNLNVADINNLEYKDLIFIKDAYYRINKIENFSLTENSLTKVELVKLLRVDINYDCTIDATVELISGTPSGSCCLNPFTISTFSNSICSATRNFNTGNTISTYYPTVSGTTGTIYYTWGVPTGDGSVTGGTSNLTPTLPPLIFSGLTYTGTASTGSTVTYSITGTTEDGFCSAVSGVLLTVRPVPIITSTLTPTGITGGDTFNYTITSTLPTGVTYSWIRTAFGDNPASSGNTSSISEVLVNTGTTTQYATYRLVLNPSLGCYNVYDMTVPVYSSTTPPPTGSTYNYYLVYRVEFPYSVKWTLSQSAGSDAVGDWVTVPFDIGTSSNQDIRYYVNYNLEPTQLVSCYLDQMDSQNTCSHPSVMPSDYIVNVSNISIDDPTFVNTSGSIWQKIDGGDTYNIIIMPAF